jgi:hypothetical protein
MNAKPIAPVVVVSLLIGAIAGFYFGNVVGNRAGFTKARVEDAAILDLAFPPPAQELKSLSGTISNVTGGTMTIMVNDPDDYLPHVDGSARDTERRYADAGSKTEFVLIDYTIREASGDPVTTVLSIADFVAGDVVTVRSNDNIRDAERFYVYRVEKVRY